jgi:hygromycin-B 7''-O-kinase
LFRFLVESHYAKRRTDLELWREPILAALARVGAPLGELRGVTEDATNVVFELGDVYFFKAYPPFFGGRERLHHEAMALRVLATNPEVPAPTVAYRGELDPDATDWKWPFLVLPRLPGKPYSLYWNQASNAEQAMAARSIGKLLREIHRSGPGHELPIAVTKSWPGGFGEFLERNREWKRHLSEMQGAAIWDDLMAADVRSLGQGWGVLLHGDFDLSHLLSDGPKITGVLDFGDVLIGDPIYDFVTVAIWTFDRHPELLQAFAEGYGLTLDARFFEKLGTFALLHEATEVPDILPWVVDSGASTREELGRYLWGVG